MIGVNCARVELAQCEGELATICESFFPHGADYQIWHGWEILQSGIAGYNASKRFRQNQHNLKNIASSVEAFSGERYGAGHTVFEELVSYALLDGLIGNTDRHHENWALALILNDAESWLIATEVMPSFDHAASLGRELSDARRKLLLESDGLLNYIHRGSGGVFVRESVSRAPAPLQLTRLLCRWSPEYTRSTLDNIRQVSCSDFRDAIYRIPDQIMSDIAKDFAFRLVIASRDELLRSAL